MQLLFKQALNHLHLDYYALYAELGSYKPVGKLMFAKT